MRNRGVDKRRKRKFYAFLCTGLFLLLLSYVPVLILGENSYASIHDQLDGDVLAYCMRARHLLAGHYDEFMTGMSATSLTPASPGIILLYCLFSSYTAYALTGFLVSLAAYIGMYLCVNYMTKSALSAMVSGVLFSLLPFYAVYGLSVMGQPLFFYAIMLATGKKRCRTAPYVLIALFGVFSSLTLVGFADCAILGIVWLYSVLFRKKYSRKVFIMLLELIMVYVLLNIPLFAQLFFGAESHRLEMALTSSDLKTGFQEIFNGNQQHAISLHADFKQWVLYVAALGLAGYPFLSKSGKHSATFLVLFLSSAALVALWYALFHGETLVSVREKLGSLGTVQFDRAYWLNPALWYCCFGCTIYLLTIPYAKIRRKGRRQKPWVNYLLRGVSLVGVLLACVMTCNTANTIYENSFLKKNLSILDGDNSYTTWKKFFNTDLFDEIRSAIGRPVKEYRVASVGLYPSVPLYNGFYCVDGYSNNYDLEYKHSFRRIIEAELDKSEYLADYFDNWGNRCYIFSSELGTRFYFGKDQKISNLQLNNEALHDMGCEYIFAGTEILNYMDSGLALIGQFENEIEPYCIYVYEVV